MKEMNSLENQLRSLRPRRPSSALKRRIFGFSLMPRAAWFLGPLAPAVACALLTFGVWGSRGVLPVASHGTILLASNINNTAVADGFANKQNSWTLVTFNSTNHSGLGSVIDSLRH
jgi:hypothetical protein